MNRFAVSQFDASTYVVFDQIENKEICVCAGYEDADSPNKQAVAIADALNQFCIESSNTNRPEI